MITWLDYKPSPWRLSICLSQREQQNIAAQSVIPKYHHWASCFYFLFKCWKVLNLLCFFSTQIDHLNGLQTIIKLWTSESHIALWHNLAQFNSICHPVHYWAQYGLVWHIIKAAYLNSITKTSPLVQFEKMQLNLPQFGTVVHHTSQNLCCRTDCYAQNWVLFPDLGRFSTIWHFNISSWGEHMSKLQNATGKWNENSKLTQLVVIFLTQLVVIFPIWKNYQEYTRYSHVLRSFQIGNQFMGG